MIYIKKLAVSVLSLTVLLSTVCFSAFAATASARIEISSTSVNVGDTVSAKFVFSSSEKIYQVKMNGTYNSSLLEFVSSDLPTAVANGGVITATSGGHATEISFSVKFKAIAVGDCTIAVLGSEIDEFTDNPTANVKVNVKNTAATSSNANLSSITISAGTLSPAFNPNVTTYSTTVSNNVTQVLISATTSDSGAKWSVSGDKNLSVGSNKRVITVTSQAGTTKDYTININRDGDSNVSSSTDVGDILIDGIAYKLSNDFSGVSIPNGFEETTHSVNGNETTVFKHKSVDMVLVCLNNKSAGNKLFVYVQESNTFSSLSQLTFQDRTYIAVKDYASEDIAENYVKSDISIHDLTVTAWHLENSELTDFYLLYLINQEGEVGLYQYDSSESTVQRYVASTVDDSELSALETTNENLNSSLKTARIVGGVLIVLSSLLIVLLIVGVVISKKNRTK